jgi:hypothetical protein
MADPIVFAALLHRVSTDADGESKVTFTVPLSHLPALIRLGLMLHTVLNVTVQQESVHDP